MPGKFNDSARSVDALTIGVAPAESLIGRVSPGRRRRRNDWRQGGRSVEKWDSRVLAVALLGLGAGILGAGLANVLLPSAPIVSTLALWSGLIAATAFAFLRSRPAGLMRIRPTDLLWGFGLGLMLRVLQGWVSGADTAAFPSTSSATGAADASWWLMQLLPAGLIGPVVEEFFFRAVLIVAVYQLLRRSVGPAAAAVTALLVSAGIFVMLHGMRGILLLNDGLVFFAVGAACGLVVLLTGRLWGAVLLHMVYNVSYLLLVLVGAALA